jgi:hypothetical protein
MEKPKLKNNQSIKNNKLYFQIEEKLKKYNDIYEAEDFVRSLTNISAAKKLEFLSSNPKILQLRSEKKKYRSSHHLTKRGGRFREALKSIKARLFSPLQNRINKIENQLGLDVASYFKFTSWLITQNLISFFFIILPFLCIPQIIILDYNFKSNSNKTSLHCSYMNTSFEAIDLLVADVCLNHNFNL